MPFDYLPYQQKSSALQSGLDAKTNASIYARFLNKQRGTRKTEDLTRAYEAKAPQVVGGYTQRGLAGPGVQSGVFQRGMNNFSIDKGNAFTNLNESINEQDQVYANQLADASAQTSQDLADLEIQKQRDIAASAATLSAFKPYLS